MVYTNYYMFPFFAERKMISSHTILVVCLLTPCLSKYSPYINLPVTWSLDPLTILLYASSLSPGLNTTTLCQSVLLFHSLSPALELILRQLELVAKLKVVTGFSSVPRICGSSPTLPRRVTWFMLFSPGPSYSLAEKLALASESWWLSTLYLFLLIGSSFSKTSLWSSGLRMDIELLQENVLIIAGWIFIIEVADPLVRRNNFLGIILMLISYYINSSIIISGKKTYRQEIFDSFRFHTTSEKLFSYYYACCLCLVCRHKFSVTLGLEFVE